MKKNNLQCNESIILLGTLTLTRSVKTKQGDKNKNESNGVGSKIFYRKRREFNTENKTVENKSEVDVSLSAKNNIKAGSHKSKQRRLMDKYISALAIYYPILTLDLPVPITKCFHNSVFEDIKKRSLPLTEKDVVRGLRAYVSSSRYHSAVLKGQWRYDIYGEPTEEINKEDKAYAGKMLKLFGKHKK
ncbi:ProQ/FINO family protein [Serratia fonticola]